MTDGISGKTKVCGIIGYPIEHTMSPPIHNAAFKAMGLDYVYVAFGVKPEDVGKAVQGMRAFNMRGMSVTIPHKLAVIPYIDKLDPLAEKIGAVNTIVNDDGILTGYNTDALGFLQPLLEKGVEPEGKNVVIVGAGGASRAVSFILADRGANLVILNRKEELDWAENIAANVTQAFGRKTRALELTRKNLKDEIATADILVNVTSVGMHPKVDATAVPGDLLNSGLIVCDVVYNPLKTRLIREAEAAGATTFSGIDMLVWQGVIAFEKWTGVKPPVDLMKEEAIKGFQH